MFSSVICSRWCSRPPFREMTYLMRDRGFRCAQGKNPDVAMRVQNCEFYNNSKAAVACSGSPCKVTILNSTVSCHLGSLFPLSATGGGS